MESKKQQQKHAYVVSIQQTILLATSTWHKHKHKYQVQVCVIRYTKKNVKFSAKATKSVQSIIQNIGCEAYVHC